MIEEEHQEHTPSEAATAEEILTDSTESSVEQLVEELISTDNSGDVAVEALQDLPEPSSDLPTEVPAEVIASFQVALAERDKEIQSLKTQLEGQTGQYARIAADFDNFRKRTQREREEMEVQIKCSTLSELLPVVDNFDRARAHIQPKTEGEEAIQKSYQSLYKQLVDCLKRTGVAPMRAEGKEFDPNLHEAVLREPTNQHADGTVIEELQRGYMLGDRVLRHAMVKVAVASEPVLPSEESTTQES